MDALVELVDVLPTLVEAAGLPRVPRVPRCPEYSRNVTLCRYNNFLNQQSYIFAKMLRLHQGGPEHAAPPTGGGWREGGCFLPTTQGVGGRVEGWWSVVYTPGTLLCNGPRGSCKATQYSPLNIGRPSLVVIRYCPSALCCVAMRFTLYPDGDPSTQVLGVRQAGQVSQGVTSGGLPSPYSSCPTSTHNISFATILLLFKLI